MQAQQGCPQLSACQIVLDLGAAMSIEQAPALAHPAALQQAALHVERRAGPGVCQAGEAAIRPCIPSVTAHGCLACHQACSSWGLPCQNGHRRQRFHTHPQLYQAACSIKVQGRSGRCHSCHTHHKCIRLHAASRYKIAVSAAIAAAEPEGHAASPNSQPLHKAVVITPCQKLACRLAT